MEDLKSCPFCGEKPAVNYYPHLNRYDVVCASGWGCAVMPSTFVYTNKEDAIDAWNARAEHTCERGEEFWECTSCGMRGLHDSWHYCPNCGAKVVI